MLARERTKTLAASATMLMRTPLLPAASSPTIRVSTKHSYGMRVCEVKAAVNRLALPVRGSVSARSHRMDTFTAADMAVLDAVERVVVEDRFDYDSLLDYDDD